MPKPRPLRPYEATVEYDPAQRWYVVRINQKDDEPNYFDVQEEAYAFAGRWNRNNRVFKKAR